MSRPLWLVCEDGREYLERFTRFLGAEFRFAAAGDGEALRAMLAAGEAAGVILDLDFRRTPTDRLLDDQGRSGRVLGEAEAKQLAEIQGLLILQHLRAQGYTLPVLLFADLDDPEQAAYLAERWAPLQVVPGHEGLVQTAARMRALG